MSQAVPSKSTSRRAAPARHGWLWLTIPITALMALASAVGVFVPGVYERDKLYFAVQGMGQDFADLFIVAPVLAVSGYLAARGSRRAEIVWLGAIIYALYSYVIYAFFVHFNMLFLVYVALLGCSLYALIFCLRGIDARDFQRRMQGQRSAKAAGIMLGIIVVMFYSLWLKDAVPALLANTIPQSAADSGLFTNPVEVLDMAIILPGSILIVIGLRKKEPISYVLAPALLGFTLFLAIALISMAVFMMRAGLTGDLSVVAIFGFLSLTNLTLLAWYLRDLRPD